MKLLLFSLMLSAIACAQKTAQTITILHANAYVCAYLAPIVGQPCRQGVLVSIKSSGLTPEAFKVTLSYRDATGKMKLDSRIAMPTVESEFVSAAVTFFFDDITVVSVSSVAMVASGDIATLPE